MKVETIARRHSDHDIYFDPSTGGIAMVSGKDAYAQIVEAAVETQRGELQYATNVGIRYFESVLDSENKVSVWKADVSSRVLAFSFVKSITSFTVSIAKNVLSYVLTFETDEGTVIANG